MSDLGDQTTFNLRRWEEVLVDPELRKFAGRVETDRQGRIVLTPVLPVQHGQLEAEVGILLSQLMPSGHTAVVCPVSTADGVWAVDVVWSSEECWRELHDRECFVRAPEICVEVMLPTDLESEDRDKAALYFHAGAREFWTCGSTGKMSFFGLGSKPLNHSKLCPNFPDQLDVE